MMHHEYHVVYPYIAYYSRKLHQSDFSHDDITLFSRRVFNPKFCIGFQTQDEKGEKEKERL